MKNFNPKSILIIGFQGSLAKTTAHLLLEKFPEVQIHGVDSRHIDGVTELPRLSYERVKYTRTQFERIFRERNFDCILHLGRIGSTKLINDMSSKININLIGTNNLLELAFKYQSKKVIILSTHHVYGALADNSMFLSEEAPLRASFKFPDLRDVVEMDQICTNWMWKNQNSIETIVLRPANIIGTQINNSISKYLKSNLTPYPLDYNPMMQFIHEYDMSKVISDSVESLTTGIYNIATDEILTLQDAIKIVGVKKIPVPLFLVEKTSQLLRPLWKFPTYLIDFLKYPTTIDNSEFKKSLSSFKFKYSTKEALQTLNKFAFIGIILLSKFAFAENISPFDFLEASRKITSVQNRKPPGSIDQCHVITSANNESVLSCSIKDIDYQTPIVKIDYKSGQIPEAIKTILPEKFIKDTQNKDVSCVFRFKIFNDNIDMKDKKKGDDIWKTHGIEAGASCASKDGISTAFSYSTDLYTNPMLESEKKNENGLYTMKQKFNVENIFQVIQDNINQGQVTYWKRGVGFINITDQKKWGLLQAAGQQEWYHHVLNQVSKNSATEYIYENGSKNQWGAFVTLAIGLQENRKLGDSCNIYYGADIGARAATLKTASTLNLNLNTKFSYSLSENSSLYLRAQSETTRRSTSTITENTLAAGFQNRNGSFIETGVIHQNGNRKDVYEGTNPYTGKNDKLFYVRIGSHF